jgi:hypothetical protein
MDFQNIWLKSYMPNDCFSLTNRLFLTLDSVKKSLFFGYGVMIGSHEQERTKYFFAVSVNKSRVPSTKDQTEAGKERSLLQHSLTQSNND